MKIYTFLSAAIVACLFGCATSKSIKEGELPVAGESFVVFENGNPKVKGYVVVRDSNGETSRASHDSVIVLKLSAGTYELDRWNGFKSCASIESLKFKVSGKGDIAYIGTVFYPVEKKDIGTAIITSRYDLPPQLKQLPVQYQKNFCELNGSSKTAESLTVYDNSKNVTELLKKAYPHLNGRSVTKIQVQ